MSTASTVWRSLEEIDTHIDAEGDRLKQIWVKIWKSRKKIEEQRKILDETFAFDFLNPAALIQFNVGGTVFESTVETLTKDKYSVLASLCQKSSLARLDARPVFIDRDWWIFQHVLVFLTSNTLPNDRILLDELLKEADYYRLTSLKHAIRSLPSDQVMDCYSLSDHHSFALSASDDAAGGGATQEY